MCGHYLLFDKITAKKSIVEAPINYGYVDDIVSSTKTQKEKNVLKNILKPMIDSYLMHSDVSYFTKSFQANGQ